MPETESNKRPASQVLTNLATIIDRGARFDASILMEGSDNGKQAIARLIHDRSTHWTKTFCYVDCADIPADAIGLEMWGDILVPSRAEGWRRAGIFERVDKGTLFLDHVDALPPDVQERLANTIQSGSFTKIGSEKTFPFHPRIIATCNTSAADAHENGAIKDALFYQLGGIVVNIPPLSERKEDIGLLAKYFVDATAKKGAFTAPKIPQHTLSALQDMEWTGNVQQLEKVMASVARSAQDKGTIEPDAVMKAKKFRDAVDNRDLRHETSPKKTGVKNRAAQRTNRLFPPPTVDRGSIMALREDRVGPFKRFFVENGKPMSVAKLQNRASIISRNASALVGTQEVSEAEIRKALTDTIRHKLIKVLQEDGKNANEIDEFNRMFDAMRWLVGYRDRGTQFGFDR